MECNALKIYDPQTNAFEQELRKIVYNQYIANKLSDAFVETKQVTKSFAIKVPARIEIPIDNKATENECNGLFFSKYRFNII